MTDNKITEEMENGKMVYTECPMCGKPLEIKVAVCGLITALKQTVGLMTSTDYKERLVGEFVQAVIRNKKLERFIEAVNSGAIQPQEHCDMETLDILDIAYPRYCYEELYYCSWDKAHGRRLTEEGIELPEVEG